MGERHHGRIELGQDRGDGGVGWRAPTLVQGDDPAMDGSGRGARPYQAEAFDHGDTLAGQATLVRVPPCAAREANKSVAPIESKPALGGANGNTSVPSSRSEGGSVFEMRPQYRQARHGFAPPGFSQDRK